MRQPVNLCCNIRLYRELGVDKSLSTFVNPVNSPTLRVDRVDGG